MTKKNSMNGDPPVRSNRKHFRWSCLGLILVVGLVSAGCKDVVFVEPVSTSAAAVDPAPYLGSWTVIEAGGEPSSEMIEVVTRLEEGELRASITQGTIEADRRCLLTRVDDLVVLSVELGPEVWSQYVATLTAGDTQLELRGADPALFRQRVEAGAVAGEVQVVDDLSELIQVELTGEELAAALVNEPALFDFPAFVLDKG